MLNTPFSPWPSFSQEEINAAVSVLQSGKVNYWTGTQCREFEKEFAVWTGTKHAISLANGTLALELALRALKIGPGDEVIVTPRTFIASASSVINVGATPIFADVELNTGNISAKTIAAVLSNKTKAVICVHLAGIPCDMEPIMDLAEANNITVIEDCAQAHGAIYKGRSVGSIGHIGAWSFCQDKIMTTAGEGGMVTTNDDSLWSLMWSYKDHGKNYNSTHSSLPTKGFRWVHDSFGSNFRMTEVQAAIGRIQLKKMSNWTNIRNSNAKKIIEAVIQFAQLDGPITLPDSICGNCIESQSSSDCRSCINAYYKFYLYVRPENLKNDWSRDRIVEEINRHGVPCYYGSCSEVYLEKAFKGCLSANNQSLRNAKKLGEVSMMFLVHPTLLADDIKKTCDVLNLVLEEASKTSLR